MINSPGETLSKLLKQAASQGIRTKHILDKRNGGFFIYFFSSVCDGKRDCSKVNGVGSPWMWWSEFEGKGVGSAHRRFD